MLWTSIKPQNNATGDNGCTLLKIKMNPTITIANLPSIPLYMFERTCLDARAPAARNDCHEKYQVASQHTSAPNAALRAAVESFTTQPIKAETGIIHACKRTKAFANRRSIKRLVRLIIYSLTAIMLDKFNWWSFLIAGIIELPPWTCNRFQT